MTLHSSFLSMQSVRNSGGELLLLRDALSQHADAVRYQDLCGKVIEEEIKRMEKDALQQQVRV